MVDGRAWEEVDPHAVERLVFILPSPPSSCSSSTIDTVPSWLTFPHQRNASSTPPTPNPASQSLVSTTSPSGARTVVSRAYTTTATPVLISSWIFGRKRGPFQRMSLCERLLGGQEEERRRVKEGENHD